MGTSRRVSRPNPRCRMARNEVNRRDDMPLNRMLEEEPIWSAEERMAFAREHERALEKGDVDWAEYINGLHSRFIRHVLRLAAGEAGAQ